MTSLLVSALVVLGASYGRNDVTDQVRSMVMGDGLEIGANNGVFGDTWPGMRKTLVIVYQYDGDSPHTLVITEGGVAVIHPMGWAPPPPAAVYVAPAAPPPAVVVAEAPPPVYDAPPPTYAAPPPPPVYVAPPPPPSPVGYWGMHPIPGGGWCLIGGPHLHPYEPEFFDQFRLVDGYFKYGEGFHSWYYTHPHPILGGGWCPIDGPHQHPYRPEVGFIYDPVHRGYYYDRERAVVVRTQPVQPPPSYRPPPTVVEHWNHPPPLRQAPPGTPRPQPWAHEHVLEQPHPLPIRPARTEHLTPPPRPVAERPMEHEGERPMEREGERPVGEHPMPAHAAPARESFHEQERNVAPARAPAAKAASTKPSSSKKKWPDEKK